MQTHIAGIPRRVPRVDREKSQTLQRKRAPLLFLPTVFFVQNKRPEQREYKEEEEKKPSDNIQTPCA
jgi:hypothetical protein